MVKIFLFNFVLISPSNGGLSSFLSDCFSLPSYVPVLLSLSDEDRDVTSRMLLISSDITNKRASREHREESGLFL